MPGTLETGSICICSRRSNPLGARSAEWSCHTCRGSVGSEEWQNPKVYTVTETEIAPLTASGTCYLETLLIDLYSFKCAGYCSFTFQLPSSSPSLVKSHARIKILGEWSSPVPAKSQPSPEIRTFRAGILPHYTPSLTCSGDLLIGSPLSFRLGSTPSYPKEKRSHTLRVPRGVM